MKVVNVERNFVRLGWGEDGGSKMEFLQIPLHKQNLQINQNLEVIVLHRYETNIGKPMRTLYYLGGLKCPQNGNVVQISKRILLH